MANNSIPDPYDDESSAYYTPPGVQAAASTEAPQRIAQPRFWRQTPAQQPGGGYSPFSGSAFATPLPQPGSSDRRLRHSGQVEDSMARYQHRAYFDEPSLMASAIQAPDDESFLMGQQGSAVGSTVAATPPTWRNQQVPPVDQSFLQNLNQEGDLELLTRKAVQDTRKAWKTEVMGKLKREVDRLDDDQWMFQAGSP